MTIGVYFKCPLCQEDFCIKLQMDNTFKLYDWPIHIGCPNCGNEMDLFFNSNGLQPKELKCDEAEKCVTMGYSAVLPLTKDLYFHKLGRAGRMVFASPFMNLSRSYGKFDITATIGNWAGVLSHSLIPYRHYLLGLLPLINHSPINVTAFSTKLAQLCEATNHKPLKDEVDCMDAFVGLHDAVYRYLTLDSYEGTSMKKFFNQLVDYVKNADVRQVEKMHQTVTGVMSTNAWLMKEAFEIVSVIVNEIQLLLPSLFLPSIGYYNPPAGHELYIMTVGYQKLNKWYAELFEGLAHILPFIVGLNNAMKNGDADVFMVNGTQWPGTLADFSKLNTAGRLAAINQDVALRDTYIPVLNNHIRNAIQHNGVVYQVQTQLVEYHYDTTNNQLHDDFRLIDVGFMIYMQLLHLLEAIQLISNVDKRMRAI